jgi:hypothetical protein
MDNPNYRSGDEYVLEFVGHRYEFSSEDFRERVAAAAVRLGLAEPADLVGRAREDLAEIVSTGALATPRSRVGRYLAARWDEIESHGGESLVYWLRKLVFRGAWLDHRVKSGMLEIVFDESEGEFQYRLPTSERPAIELAGHPSWADVRYAGR